MKILIMLKKKTFFAAELLIVDIYLCKKFVTETLINIIV